MTMRKKLLAVYERVGEEIYLSHEDLVIDGQRFCSTLLLELLALVTRSNVLVLGEYGTGKTTTAEVASCIMAGFPLDAVIKSELRGSPELTEEKVVGPPDLGKLNQGVLEVCWSPFVKSPTHIIDELPRIPEIKQAIILEGVRTGLWIYHGERLATARSSLIATGNYESLGGSFSICPALMDRFAIALETTYAGPQQTLAIAMGRDTAEKCSALGLNELSSQALSLLSQPYDAVAMRSLSRQFKERLVRQGFPVLQEQEMEAARGEIGNVPFSPEAERFLMFFASAQNFCGTTGQKRSSRFGDSSEQRSQCPDDCRFARSACSYVVNGGSRRIERDLVTLSRSLAWVTGEREVALQHLVSAVPFVVWHRSQFSRNFLRELKDQERSRPLRLEAAARYAHQLEQEFTERRQVIAEVLCGIEQRPDDLVHGRVDVGGRPHKVEELPHWFLIDVCRSAQSASGRSPRTGGLTE